VAFATMFGDVQMLRKELVVEQGDLPPDPAGAQPPALTQVTA